MAIPAVAFLVTGVTSTATTWTLLVRRVTTSDSGATYAAGPEAGSIPLSSLAEAAAFGALVGKVVVFGEGRVGALVT